MAVAVGLLPIWDAVEQHRMYAALAGVSFGPSPLSSGRGPSAVAPLLGWGFVSLIAALGLWVARTPKTRWWLFLGFGCLSLGYATVTLTSTARTRSHAVATWPTCETWDAEQQEFWESHGSRVMPSRVEGPRRPDGEPCMPRAEVDMERFRSGGMVLDGLSLIWTRFPRDRTRVLDGTVAVVLLIGFAGVLGHDPWWRRRPRAAEPQRSSST